MSRNRPSYLHQAASFVKITEGLRGIRQQRQLEKIRVDKELQSVHRLRIQNHKEKLAVREKEVMIRMKEAQLLKLEDERAEIKARTRTHELRYQLDSVKLAKMDPDMFPDGTVAYECPICDTYYTNPNPNLLYCSKQGCHNQPLIKTVLNLN